MAWYATYGCSQAVFLVPISAMLTDGSMQSVILGNTLAQYVYAFGVFVVVWVLFYLFQRVLVAQVERLVGKTNTDFDDALVEMVARIRPPLYSLIAFYVALRQIEVSGLAEISVRIVLLTWVTFEVIAGIQLLLDIVVRKKLERDDDRSTEVVTSLVRGVSRIILWSIGVLFIMQNLGINVTSLIAGIGIGGIAIALAAQNILGDLFSSLAIYFDKPFKPGDFISADDVKGTVQRVGIKTTRVKGIDGEEIVVPNQDLTSSRIKNIQKRKNRRVVFTFGVTYDTGNEKMHIVPEMVQAIIEGVDGVVFDRAHFVSFDDSALTFEVVYKVQSNEYGVYMDANQMILLAIKEKFETEKIEMAYPTQTIYVAK